MEKLPQEIKAVIVAYLDIKQAARCRCTSKSILQAVDKLQDLAWAFKFARTFTDKTPSSIALENNSWKDHYMHQIGMIISIQKADSYVRGYMAHALLTEEAWSWSMDDYLSSLVTQGVPVSVSHWKWAAEKSYYQLMKLLLKHHVPVPESTLYEVLKGESPDERCALLLWHAGIYEKKRAFPESGYEYDYLYLTVLRGMLQLSKLLLEAGANVNHFTEGSWGYLRTAIRADNIEMAQLLLDHGACLDGLWERHQKGPIRCVKSNNMLKLLLKAGAREQYDEDRYDYTLFSKAVEKCDLERLKILLEQETVTAALIEYFLEQCKRNLYDEELQEVLQAALDRLESNEA